jgi:uncharacterized protein YkwD
VSARRTAASLAGAVLAACALGGGAPSHPLVRVGPNRLELPYEERLTADKRALFERINRDRLRHGAPAVAWEPRAALMGDAFCLDNALTGAFGHWDLQGRAPYLRWGLAGGVDYHAQNAASWSLAWAHLEGPFAELLLQSHESMMAEIPPDDGHRRLILDPAFTHLGIGLAVVGSQLRLTEEFTRVAFEWVAVPPHPLAAGSVASVRGRALPGWEVGLAEVRFEPPPQPLTLLAVRSRRSYGYPPAVRTLYPTLGRDDLVVRHNREVGVRFSLDQGAGHYFVLYYVRRAGDRRTPWIPATAALVTALE